MNSTVIDRVVISKRGFYDLAPHLQELVCTHGRPVPSVNPDVLTFQMARPSWEEINEVIAKAQGAAT